jgi:cytochrome c-type protein NapC
MARTLRLFAPPKRVIGPLLWIIVTLLVALPLLLSAGWVIAQYGIQETTEVEFCTSCHSMSPMGESYRMDVHGGRSVHGVQASCSDCHLPHDNPLTFVLAYWRRLLGDGWVELVHGTQATDWEALRDERESYVFDSGCLGCHRNLLNAFPRNTDGYAAHKTYFGGETHEKCVSCHMSVGHKNLGASLIGSN